MSRRPVKGKDGEAGILPLQTRLLAHGVSNPEMISMTLGCQ